MNLSSSTVLSLPGLVAFWDFQNPDWTDLTSNRIALSPKGATPALVDGGVFGPYALPFTAQGNLPDHYLVAERERVPELNLGGPGVAVTVVAWLAKDATEYLGCQFVAGVWNEHHQRQYALFLNLGIRNFNAEGVKESRQTAAGHFSTHGGATPGWPYCMDGAVGKTDLHPGDWHTVATSYDGREIRLYLDGLLDANPPITDTHPFGANPFPYTGDLYKGEADFTIGATRRPDGVVSDGKGGFEDRGSTVANPFVGRLGGVAIFDRALTDAEQVALAGLVPKP